MSHTHSALLKENLVLADSLVLRLLAFSKRPQTRDNTVCKYTKYGGKHFPLSDDVILRFCLRTDFKK